LSHAAALLFAFMSYIVLVGSPHMIPYSFRQFIDSHRITTAAFYLVGMVIATAAYIKLNAIVVIYVMAHVK
jgi:hypothetical protein